MYDRILVTTDGSAAARAAVAHAVDIASRYDATLHVLSVVDLRPWKRGAESAVMTDELEERAEDAVETVAAAARDRGVAVETAVVRGVPHGEILEYAADPGVDLVVMGTHGRTGLRHAVMGSVAEKVVRRSPCPVLTVRMDDEDDG